MTMTRYQQSAALDLAGLARFRGATYHLLGQSFLYPDEARIEEVARTARELRACGKAFRRLAVFPRWKNVMGALSDLTRLDLGFIQGQHTRLFAANPAGVPCPPYESAYQEPAGGSTGQLLAQVDREYAYAGLALAGKSGELPDLVSVEMEFVAVLCGRESQAWEAANRRKAADLLGREKDFLDSHLARWFPDFADRVRAADAEGTYATLCVGAEAVIGYDVDLLGALLEFLGVLPEPDSPSGIGRPEGNGQ